MNNNEVHEKMPQEITDYLDFLNSVDETKNKLVTKKRIDKNFDNFGNAINTFLAYPDKLVELMTPRDSKFHLYFSQVMTLRVMSRHRQSFHTYTRGFSKSFLSSLSRYIGTMLVPGHKAFMVAGTKEQGANIAKEKVVGDLWEKFPLLANEMKKTRVAGKVRDAYKQGKDYAEFRFTHGGVFDVVGAGGGIRGARRHSGIFEEVIEHDPKEINEKIIPLMNKQREDSKGNINPKEPHGNKIFVTTAGFQGTFAYEKLIENVCYAVVDPKRYAVFGGSYDIPLMHGLLDKQAVVEMLSSPSFEDDSIDREYRSIWSGSTVGAAFSAKGMKQLRKVVHADREDKATGEDFYVVSADMAKDGSANTAVVVMKVSPREYAFFYKVVNLFKIETSDYKKVSAELKKAVQTYNARLLIYDANGIGAAIRDWLNKDQLDEESGMPLDALGIINPPTKVKKDVAKVNAQRTICYEIKATGEEASVVHKVFFSKIGANNVRFLIKSQEAIERLSKTKQFNSMDKKQRKAFLRPYFTMDLLEEELKNLDVAETSDNMSSNKMKIVRRSRKIQKDFFSASEYAVYGVQNYLETAYYTTKRKGIGSMADYIMGT